MKNKSVDYYLRLPYKVEVFPDEEGQGFTAVVPELPGCMTACEEFSQLLGLLEDAKRVWIEAALANGDPIPEPLPEEEKEYSGKFLVRVPRSLHRQLSLRANMEGTSLNQLVVAMLAEAVGRLYERQVFIPTTHVENWIIRDRFVVTVLGHHSDPQESRETAYRWNEVFRKVPLRPEEVLTQ